MTIKEISYKELEKAIKIAFVDDKKIFNLYDPHVKVETVDDIVKDIVKKIDHFTGAKLMGVYENEELIGYFAYRGKILISFSIAMNYRIRKYLREFFQLMNKELKKDFVCYLWRRNSRAIRWLEKNGLEGFEFTDDIVKLCCPVKATNHSLN